MSTTSTQTIQNRDLIRAFRGESTDRVPVWFMRQAGRFNPRHRELYEEHGVRGITTTPELNATVSTLPVEDLGVDAAVMYADIMLPLEDMGVEFHYGEGDTGPLMETDISTPEDVDELRVLDPERGVPYILEAVRRVKDRLDGSVPVIGFSGGPFTLSAYVIEGKPSRTFQKTKAFMHEYPEAYRNFMQKITDSIVTYLRAKHEAGVDVLQLFESWMGALAPETFRTFVQPYLREIYRELEDLDAPTVLFGTNTAGMLQDHFDSGADAVGVDWRITLEEVAERVGTDTPVMGNLDPAMVFAPEDQLEKSIRDIIDAGRAFSGHVFNLGHRVPNDAEVDDLRKIVDFVHEYSAQ
jgi:uroporphyrinogen decarboxylase